MFEYKKPEVEVIEFDADVITTSEDENELPID